MRMLLPAWTASAKGYRSTAMRRAIATAALVALASGCGVYDDLVGSNPTQGDNSVGENGAVVIVHPANCGCGQHPTMTPAPANPSAAICAKAAFYTDAGVAKSSAITATWSGEPATRTLCVSAQCVTGGSGLMLDPSAGAGTYSPTVDGVACGVISTDS